MYRSKKCLLWGWVACNSVLTSGQNDIGGDSKQTSSDDHTHTYTDTHAHAHSNSHMRTHMHTHKCSPKQSPVYRVFTLNSVCWNMRDYAMFLNCIFISNQVAKCLVPPLILHVVCKKTMVHVCHNHHISYRKKMGKNEKKKVEDVVCFPVTI